MVMLNDRLDYFGATINMASRVSDLAEGTETTLSEAVLAEPGVEALLSHYAVESFQAHVRGLSGSLTVYRVRAFPQPAP